MLNIVLLNEIIFANQLHSIIENYEEIPAIDGIESKSLIHLKVFSGSFFLDSALGAVSVILFDCILMRIHSLRKVASLSILFKRLSVFCDNS